MGLRSPAVLPMGRAPAIVPQPQPQPQRAPAIDENSIWMSMPTEQVQDIEKKYKAKNGIEEQSLREQKLKEEKQKMGSKETWMRMKETVPYLER